VLTWHYVAVTECDCGVWQTLTSLSEVIPWHFARWSLLFKDRSGLSMKTRHLMTMYSTGRSIVACCSTTCILTLALCLRKSSSRCWASSVEHKFPVLLLQINSYVMLLLAICECDLHFCIIIVQVVFIANSIIRTFIRHKDRQYNKKAQLTQREARDSLGI